jgi:hypothetical protein
MSIAFCATDAEGHAYWYARRCRLLAPETPGMQREQSIHALPVLRAQSPDAPHQLAPRLDAVFLAVGESSPG